MKKKIIELTFCLFFILKINSVDYFGYPFSAKFFIGLSAAYNYKISTDFSYQSGGVFMSAPLDFIFDFRFIEWFSLASGASFIYGINTYNSNIKGQSVSFYNHNLFIRVPFQVKFYPMVYKNDSYANFFFGVGLFAHFWPINGYYYENSGDKNFGDRYNPSVKDLPPGGIYTPTNVGLKLSLGNCFTVAKNTFIGLELFADYLFIPIVNGYYNNINFKPNNNVILDFSGSIGVAALIGFELTKNE